MRVETHFEERIAPNIALIKYWGKLERFMNIPLNGSISLTLDSSKIYSSCSSKLELSPADPTDSFQLYDMDGVLIETKFHRKFPLIVDFFTNEFCKSAQLDSKAQNLFRNHLNKFRFVVRAKNSFPSSAGMASSASGACALVLSISRIFDFFREDKQDLNCSLFQNIQTWLVDKNRERVKKIVKIATLLRVVSGSSSRSLFPGLVVLNGVQEEHFGGNIMKLLQVENITFSGEIEAKVAEEKNRGYFERVMERYSDIYSKFFLDSGIGSKQGITFSNPVSLL